MPKKSAADKLVRKSAKEIPASSKADLQRLRAAMRSRIDTGEIPERRKFQRLQRDENGRLPPRKGVIREAVARQMKNLRLTPIGFGSEHGPIIPPFPSQRFTNSSRGNVSWSYPRSKHCSPLQSLAW